jgi:hypothetical protein
MELFARDSVLELNTEKLENSLRFLTITHRSLSALWFGCYGIWTIDLTAEYCFWTEQRQNGSSVSSLGLAELQKSRIPIW